MTALIPCLVEGWSAGVETFHFASEGMLMLQDVEDVDMSLHAVDEVVSFAVALIPLSRLPLHPRLRPHHHLHLFLGSPRDLCVREVCHTMIVSENI